MFNGSLSILHWSIIALVVIAIVLLSCHYFNKKYRVKVELLGKWRFSFLYTTYPLGFRVERDNSNLTIRWFGKYHMYRLKPRYFTPRTLFTEPRWYGVTVNSLMTQTVKFYWKGNATDAFLPWKRILIESNVPLSSDNLPFKDYANFRTVDTSYTLTKSIWRYHWLRWIPFFNITTRAIDIIYPKDGVGSEKDTWKGGTLSYHGLVYSNETVEDVYKRLEDQYRPVTTT